MWLVSQWEVERMKNWGKRVRELRLQHKDTLKELAEKIEYDHSNLSKIERGIYKGQIDVFQKIADVYGVDVSYFSYTDGELETFTDNEKEFIFEPDLSKETIKKKYSLIDNDDLGGQPLSDDEVEFIIEQVKSLRRAMNKRAPKQ
jgi:transcriptional regulator with XRE-family HTH domain